MTEPTPTPTPFNADEFIKKILSEGSATATPKARTALADYSSSELRQLWRAERVDEGSWKEELKARGMSEQGAADEIARQKNVGVSTAASTRGQLTASEAAAVAALRGSAPTPGPTATSTPLASPTATPTPTYGGVGGAMAALAGVPGGGSAAQQFPPSPPIDLSQSSPSGGVSRPPASTGSTGGGSGGSSGRGGGAAPSPSTPNTQPVRYGNMPRDPDPAPEWYRSTGREGPDGKMTYEKVDRPTPPENFSALVPGGDQGYVWDKIGNVYRPAEWIADENLPGGGSFVTDMADNKAKSQPQTISPTEQGMALGSTRTNKQGQRLDSKGNILNPYGGDVPGGTEGFEQVQTGSGMANAYRTSPGTLPRFGSQVTGRDPEQVGTQGIPLEGENDYGLAYAGQLAGGVSQYFGAPGEGGLAQRNTDILWARGWVPSKDPIANAQKALEIANWEADNPGQRYINMERESNDLTEFMTNTGWFDAQHNISGSGKTSTNYQRVAAAQAQAGSAAERAAEQAGDLSALTPRPDDPIYAAGGYTGLLKEPTVFVAGEAGPENVNIQPTGTKSITSLRDGLMGGSTGGATTQTVGGDPYAYLRGGGEATGTAYQGTGDGETGSYPIAYRGGNNQTYTFPGSDWRSIDPNEQLERIRQQEIAAMEAMVAGGVGGPGTAGAYTDAIAASQTTSNQAATDWQAAFAASQAASQAAAGEYAAGLIDNSRQSLADAAQGRAWAEQDQAINRAVTQRNRDTSRTDYRYARAGLPAQPGEEYPIPRAYVDVAEGTDTSDIGPGVVARERPAPYRYDAATGQLVPTNQAAYGAYQIGQEYQNRGEPMTYDAQTGSLVPTNPFGKAETTLNQERAKRGEPMEWSMKTDPFTGQQTGGFVSSDPIQAAYQQAQQQEQYRRQAVANLEAMQMQQAQLNNMAMPPMVDTQALLSAQMLQQYNAGRRLPNGQVSLAT